MANSTFSLGPPRQILEDPGRFPFQRGLCRLTSGGVCVVGPGKSSFGGLLRVSFNDAHRLIDLLEGRGKIPILVSLQACLQQIGGHTGKLCQQGPVLLTERSGSRIRETQGAHVELIPN
jgi:hypothetical protein